MPIQSEKPCPKDCALIDVCVEARREAEQSIAKKNKSLPRKALSMLGRIFTEGDIYSLHTATVAKFEARAAVEAEEQDARREANAIISQAESVLNPNCGSRECVVESGLKQSINSQLANKVGEILNRRVVTTQPN